MRRGLAVACLGSLLAPPVGAQEAPGPAAPFDRASALAEQSLQKGDREAAEGHYREALFEGWLLMSALARTERRLPEAQESLRKASVLAGESREALQSLAIAQLQSGASAEAVKILTGLAANDPTDVQVRRLLARGLAAAGQLEPAVRALDDATAAAGNDPEALFVLATEYLWLKKLDSAERLFGRVLAARPLPQTHVLVGRAYRDAGENDRARAELEAALKQDPATRRAHYYLGMVILADTRGGPDRATRAIAEFQEELKLAPQDALANDELGSTLFEAGRPAEALPSFEAAVREEPRSAFLYHLGRCQLALEKGGEAEASLRRALQTGQEEGASESDLQKVHYQLGLTLKKRGAAEEAATHLAEARRLEARASEGSSGEPTAGPQGSTAAPPDQTAASSDLPWQQRPELERRVRAGLARAYFNLGVLQAQDPRVASESERFARAAELFEQAAGVDAEFPQVQVSLGVAYFNAGKFDKATRPLALAVAASPKDAGLKRMLAMAWLNSQVYDKAAELLRDDPERDTNPSLQLAYGLALVRSGRPAEAEKFLSGVLARRPDSAEAMVLLGQARVEMGQYDSAAQALTRALQLKPDVKDAHGTLGVILLRQGRLAEAEEALRAELKGNPADLASQKSLAAVLDSAKRPQEAITLLRGLLKSQPDLAEARYLLGKILLAQGAAAEAVEHLEAAVRLAPDDPNAHYQLGQAYEKLGRLSLARQHYDASRRLKAGP